MSKKNRSFATYLTIVVTSIISTLVLSLNIIIKSYINSYKMAIYETICFHYADSGLEYAFGLLHHNKHTQSQVLSYKLDANKEVLVEIYFEEIQSQNQSYSNEYQIKAYNLISNATLSENRKKLARKRLMRLNVKTLTKNSSNQILDTGLFMEASSAL